ncbi:hypothetical protein M569_16947 [Genlisea aurea]|uniref:Cytochrome P450 n=1 Tax=Genlisea aurea TaxID=192259 RepID=S8BTI7_9LAMI|nr:hypothetical protein M569_16947 [Genlisea aurea]
MATGIWLLLIGLFLLRRIMKRDFNWRDMPFVGTFPVLFYKMRRIHDACVEVLETFHGTYLLNGPWFANLDILVTADPANVHFVMSENFANFPKGDEFRKIFDVLGDGIFNSDGEMWRRQRKQARALIAHDRFRKFLVETNRRKMAEGLIPVIERAAADGTVLDLQDIFQRFTFDTTCIFITGFDPGCLTLDLPEVPFSSAMDDAEEAIFMRHVLPEFVWKIERFLGIGHEEKLRRARATLDAAVQGYIDMKRDEISRKVSGETPAVDLLTAYIDEGESITNERDDKFLRDSILNLMIAGRDTTSSALTWFTWLVSTHPEVRRKIRGELNSLPPAEQTDDGWRYFTAEELSSLVYLHASLCESLRLYPPVPFQHKSPAKAVVLPSGHTAHPKTKVLFSVYAMGRMDYVWGKDSKEYKPERWIINSGERGTIKYEPSYKFMAFNAGPRTCLGREVAFTQLKSLAAAIVYNYDVATVEGHDVTPNVSVILYMKHGFKVKLSKRWRTAS